jgi:uncharacterized protein
MSFEYNVAGLLKEPVGATRSYVIDGRIRLADTQQQSDRLAGGAAFLRTPRGVLVSAKLEGTLNDTCSRCLKDVRQPVRLNIEEEFVQTIDIETGVRVKDADPDDFRIDARHILDLEDAMRQYWSAAMPMQVLCRADCKGLCPRCGADMNNSDHACAPEADTRWDALRELAGKVEGS